MYPVAQAPRCDLLQLRLELLELLACRRPVVDDEEHVGPAFSLELAVTAPEAQRLRRVDAGGDKSRLAFVEQRRHLGHGTPHPLGVLPSRDAADVRQQRQRGEPAASEIHAVKLRFERGVGEGERGDQRAQQRCLAR